MISFKSIFKIIKFLSMLVLFMICLFFVKNVLDNFASKATNMKRSLEKLDSLTFPTSVICFDPTMKKSSMEKHNLTMDLMNNFIFKELNEPVDEVFDESGYTLDKDFDLYFYNPMGTGYGIKLQEGTNIIEGFQEPIEVQGIESAQSHKCYKISSETKIGPISMYCNTVEFKVDDQDKPNSMNMKFLSETNAHGTAFTEVYYEGEPVEIDIALVDGPQYVQIVQLKQKDTHYLPLTSNCTEDTIYKCLAVRTMDIIKRAPCPNKCISSIYKSILTLSINESEIQECKTHEDNLCMGTSIYHGFYKLMMSQECPKKCYQTEYIGKAKEVKSGFTRVWPDTMDFEVCYGFSSTVIEVDDEYLLYGFSDMIGSVGGSFGLFIGFSFLDVIYTIFDLLQQKIV